MTGGPDSAKITGIVMLEDFTRPGLRPADYFMKRFEKEMIVC